MSDIPPLVPAEVDLRGLEWMPYYGDRLIRSEFAARVSDAAFRAGHHLWWAAWNGTPAASLPNDDISLARAADLGRDLKAWRRVKAEALHGFIECSDGRLYHKALAPLAIEAWAKRLKERKRKQAWRDAKRGGPDTSQDGDKFTAETGTEQSASAGHGQGQGEGHPRSVPRPGTDERRGEDRTGPLRKEERSSVPDGTGAAAPTLEAEVYRRGKALLGAKSGGQITRLRKALKGDDVAAIATLNEASGKQDPAEWIAGVLKRRGAEPDTDDLGLPIPDRYDADEDYRRMGVEGFARG